MKFVFKGVVALGLLGAVACADAIVITLDSAGTWTIIGTGPNWTQSESVIQSASSVAPLPQLDYLNAVITGSTGPTPGAIATYSDTGLDSLTLNWKITDQQYVGGVFSMDGTWTYLSGTGSYAGLTGAGTFAVSQNSIIGSGFSGTVLVGNLNAVPEPASIGILAVGVTALIRRRKRA